MYRPALLVAGRYRQDVSARVCAPYAGSGSVDVRDARERTVERDSGVGSHRHIGHCRDGLISDDLSVVRKIEIVRYIACTGLRIQARTYVEVDSKAR